MNTVGHKRWSQETREEIKHLLLAGESGGEIAKVYGVGKSAVYRFRHDLGIGRFEAPRSKAKNLSAVDAQIERQRTLLLQTKAELERLEALREELAIRFERDAGQIVVYGIGDQAMRATADQWTTFLRNDGARRLREFISQPARQSMEAA